MNVQGFYEYVILRDILAYILPGGITMLGFSIIAKAIGTDRWEIVASSFSNLNSFFQGAFLVLIAFLMGHVLDLLYRKMFQETTKFRHPETLRKILKGDENGPSKIKPDPIAREIREAVGQFLKIDWNKTSVDQWINSGKAFEANVLLAYWIEEEDPKLFGNEIARPIVQSHLLHVSGLASAILGVCILIAEAIRLRNGEPWSATDPLIVLISAALSFVFAWAFVSQGSHKREIIIEHAFRVFYVVWRKRVLEHKAGLRLATDKPLPTKKRPASK